MMGRGLHLITDERLRHLLTAAENRGEALVALDPSTRSALERRRGLGVSRIAPRVYARTDYWESLSPRARGVVMLRALARKHPRWTFCSTSAALAWGLYVSHARLRVVHVVGARRRPSVREGIMVVAHDAALEEVRAGEVRSAHGLRMTRLLRTVLDAMCALPFPEALAVADSAMRFYGVGREGLSAFVGEHGRGRHGASIARRAVEHADPRSENGGESVVRGLMIELGFAVPELQVEIPDPLGGPTYRVDYLWRLDGGRRVIGELDGMAKLMPDARTSPKAIARRIRNERTREARLTVGGTSVMRIPSSVIGSPRELERILEAYSIPRTHPRCRHA